MSDSELVGSVADATRELLESAVRKLGPERSQQALEAFSEPTEGGHLWDTWNHCALARAYGPRGELRALIMSAKDQGEWERAAELVGLSVDETRAIALTFDKRYWVPNAPDTALLKSLLEAEAAKINASRASEPVPA